jgi:hypothetical protein
VAQFPLAALGLLFRLIPMAWNNVVVVHDMVISDISHRASSTASLFESESRQALELIAIVRGPYLIRVQRHIKKLFSAPLLRLAHYQRVGRVLVIDFNRMANNTSRRRIYLMAKILITSSSIGELYERHIIPRAIGRRWFQRYLRRRALSFARRLRKQQGNVLITTKRK